MSGSEPNAYGYIAEGDKDALAKRMHRARGGGFQNPGRPRCPLAAVPDVVLIGDWGSWVRTGGPMSYDIDLIVNHQDLALLGTMAANISASHHLAGTEWRGTWRSVHLDLYVPYQSRLGANLQLRVEQLQAQA
jgi:hypothetical protein